MAFCETKVCLDRETPASTIINSDVLREPRMACKECTKTFEAKNARLGREKYTFIRTSHRKVKK